jgi:hypothetical protein
VDVSLHPPMSVISAAAPDVAAKKDLIFGIFIWLVEES